MTDKSVPVEPPAKWTAGKPFIATDEHCNLRWGGGRPGEKFRCALCGHKFTVGDVVRWQFTNDTPGAGGNPFVCQSCDVGRDAIIAEIKRRRNDVTNWWFK